ncbi:MAG: cytochrome c maturation protein CcmE [Alphaproteobacteria bacterium]
MKRKHRRLSVVVLAMLGLGGAAALVLTALEDNIVFFYSPTQVVEKAPAPGQRLRIGGLVKEQSRHRLDDGVTQAFIVTDLANELKVIYRGVLPDLFDEGQGVVAEGTFNPEGVFLASEVLAKHDENYLPAEVTDALKKSGRWQEGKDE